ncbi:DUF465 domain-containing protein [Terriglobus albidus]|uniref:DUF465 domain-containing protein n=1 Tax=Terriglobus albidus TaxID=1592106 RepID=A0A5B9EAK2_9BACT|nr:DUF465 domain-containing protein [Terriglobus albidus]QEE28165.1 DUF465 domain-containing protein [Terriglobus albidus]
MLPAHTEASFRHEQLTRLQMEHAQYSERLDHLVMNPHHSPADQWEEIRLKKLKLKLKDAMEHLRTD